MALLDLVGVGGPAKALQGKVLCFGCCGKLVCRNRAVALAEGVTARCQRHGFLVVHGHAGESLAHVAGHAFRIVRIAAGAFGVDVDETHLDRRQRGFQRLALVGKDARFHALVHPQLLGAPVDRLRLVDVGAATAEAEHRAAHAFDGDIAGQHEQIGPADVLAVLLLDRPQQAARLVEVAVVRPGIERGEALLAAGCAAAPVAGAIGAGRVPGHADEERAIVAVIGRPPLLAVGHQGLDVRFQGVVVDRVECLGVVEVGIVRIGAATVFLQDAQFKLIRPPVPVRAPQQAARATIAAERAATGNRACLCVHNSLLFAVFESSMKGGCARSCNPSNR